MLTIMGDNEVSDAKAVDGNFPTAIGPNCIRIAGWLKALKKNVVERYRKAVPGVFTQGQRNDCLGG
jgi:hypothetical protein